ncbi:hypothetical protein [Agathobacter sp.]
MFFKRRKSSNDEQINTVKENEPQIRDKTAGFQVVDTCEQMIDAAREFEDAREEYALVTNYLTDIEKMGNMSAADKKIMQDAASNIAVLNKKRNDFLKTENRISDSQYAQMQELENEIPRAIKRLERNEGYLDTINRDLKYLEGEKIQLDIDKEASYDQQKKLRVFAVLIILFFAAVVAVCFAMRFMMDVDTTVFMFIGALLSAAAGAFIFLSYQNEANEIKSCIANKNRAVSLENRVKIKYVNVKNSVDYTYEKYHVKNSKEFVYIYEQYLLAVKDKERFRQTSDDLEYNNRKLLDVLQKNHFYDSKVWLNYANAIVEPKEMVELKHQLIVRRQKLRGRMQYNINTITSLRRDILSHRGEIGDRMPEINRILNKIAELNMELESED